MGRAVKREDKRAFALAVWELLRLHQASMVHADRFMDSLIKLTDDYCEGGLAARQSARRAVLERDS